MVPRPGASPDASEAATPFQALPGSATVSRAESVLPKFVGAKARDPKLPCQTSALPGTLRNFEVAPSNASSYNVAMRPMDSLPVALLVTARRFSSKHGSVAAVQ